MKRNLNSLERKASRLKSGSSSKRQRRKIKRAMNRQNCASGNTRKANIGRSSIMEQIFGSSASKKRRQQALKDRRELERDRRKQNGSKRSTEESLRNYNTVRTVCVRTCDGYFFPVSFSTKKSLIQNDAEACANLCPGTQMELFFHKTSGESSQEMISAVDGRPYTEISNAFEYQKSFDPECACNYRLLARKQEVAPPKQSKSELRQQELSDTGRVAKPLWRIDRGQDPETLANSAGGLDDKAFRKLDPAQKADEVAEARKVRVIGEEFLPVQ